MLYLLLPLVAALSLELKTPSALLMNAESGAILYEKNAFEQVNPASTTKIATCLYALKKNPDFNLEIIGDQECLGTLSVKEKERMIFGPDSAWKLERDCSHMGIKVGEVLTLRDLFLGLMVISAGDASNLIAKTVSGSVPLFMTEMNAYLKSIGCLNTNFSNPHGLYDPNHKSTAFDLALMTKVALQDPNFCSFFCAKDFIRPKTNKQEATKCVQTNKLLRPGKNSYPHAIGGKTGSHSKGGYCLVAVAKKGERTLIAVLLGAPSNDARFQEAITLFEAAFNEQPIRRELISEGIQATPIHHPSGKMVTLRVNQPLIVQSFPAENEKIYLSFEWLPNYERGKYRVKNGEGKVLNETFATIDSYMEEEKEPLPWKWVALLAFPLACYLFLKRR